MATDSLQQQISSFLVASQMQQDSGMKNDCVGVCRVVVNQPARRSQGRFRLALLP